MPEILDALLACPPAVFTMQTRGPLILRDLDQLLLLSRRTRLRVSFSVTTDRDAVRRLYEPHCAPMDERFEVISRLNGAGIDAHATLAPILPCDAGHLLDLAMAASPHAIIADPLHLRERKPMGATTREQSFRIAAHHHHEDWFRAGFQDRILATMKDRAAACGRQFGFGPEAFAWLSQT
ncbi:MAG: hypothetical protein HYZ37_15865 [Candidatus Solibacter usitatus]|nr:hypothetical protein [Candidatus Solibacter usitatus]